MTFFMLGKYSIDAFKGMSEERTKKAVDIIKKHDGKVISMHVLLGGYDLAFIIDAPDVKKAMKTSIELTKLTGIGFSTFPAISVEDFDKSIIT